MDHPESGEEIELEGELALARGLILSGEYTDGARYLGFAAALDPTHPDVEDLLGVVLDEVGERAPDTVVPDDGPSASDDAVKAWLLYGVGRGEEAVDLLLHAIGSDPERRWSAWLAQWLAEDPGLAIPASTLLSACRALITPVLHDQPSEAYAETLADVTTAVARAIEGDPDNAQLRSMGSGLARRIGRLDEAVRWAAEGDELEATMPSACMLGHAHRMAGDERAAFRAFEAASSRAPSDPDPRLDAADSLANAGDWAASAEWAASAWRLAPERGTAAARTLYARYRATGDVRHATELFEWLEARAEFDDEHPDAIDDARSIADGLAARLPWTGHIPVPPNAVVNLAGHFRSVAAKQARAPLEVTVPLPESPSALLALEHAVGRPLDVVTVDVPTPDPRLPRGPVRTLSWRLYESHLAPAVPAPPGRALDAVHLTATRWYRWSTAVGDAERLAAGSGTINDLVSLAVHPQPGPSGVAAWEWVRRWQVVCCLSLADRDAYDVLCDFADGPEDWVCDAALAGLVHLARRRRDLRRKVLEFATRHLVESVNRLATLDLPHFGSECELFTMLPGVPKKEADGARQLKADWEEPAQQ